MSKSANARKLVSALVFGGLFVFSIGSASAASVPAEASPHAVAAGTARPAVPAALPAGPATRGTSGVRSTRMAEYARFTLRSRDTLDMRGVEPSLYRGRYYRSSVEPTRECIAERESEGHYDVVSSSGTYRGAYQVSPELARGATWMMLPEHKRLLGTATAKAILSRLRGLPMNRWPRYWQDAAFSTVMNWTGTRSGAAHWAGGRWRC